MDGLGEMKDRLVTLFRQMVSFGVVGAIITGLSLIIYWISIRIGIHYLIGNAIAFVITVAISYVLNNLFTFRVNFTKPEWSIRALARAYFSYFITGIVINSFLLWFWNDYIGINKDLSPILNLFISIPLNFVLSKKWIYR